MKKVFKEYWLLMLIGALLLCGSVYFVIEDNTGKIAGKEVVEVYFQSPYTDYDKANGIEKAAIELCGFDKKNLLKPEETETITINVPKEELVTYDAYGHGFTSINLYRRRKGSDASCSIR